MRIQHHIPLGFVLGGLLSAIASPVAAQTTAAGVGLPYVWIQGHTGIIQEKINTDQMYDGVNAILEKIGVGGTRSTKLYRMDAIAGMERGMPVVVQSAMKGVGGGLTAEGRVTSVDRVHGKMTVQYSDGRREKLRVTQHSATGAGTLEAKGRRVIVYSSNKSGQPVAQYFKRKS